MLPGSDKPGKFSLQDVREYHTENTVHFALKVGEEETKKMQEAGMETSLKLWSTINETNMVMFDTEGKIKKYKSALEIMEEFATVRLKFYDLRKKYLINKLTLERDLLSNRARFIALIVAKKLVISNRKKADVVKDLTRLKFQKFGDLRAPRTGFEYLLIMQIVSLTKEKKEELERLAKQAAVELEKVRRTPIEKMWGDDLDRLEEAINAMFVETGEAAGRGKKRPKETTSGRQRKGKKKGGGQTEEVDEDEDETDAEKETGDLLDNPAGDISRWTTGALKSYVESAGKKKRRT